MRAVPRPSQSMEPNRDMSREFPAQPNLRELRAQPNLMDSSGVGAPKICQLKSVNHS